MKIEIIGTESLGVRGLCCWVYTGGRRILFDPGLALGYMRHNLLPHPVQIAEGEKIQKRIVRMCKNATDIVISHFHGDHMPLPDANPYQLSAFKVRPYLKNCALWTKGIDRESEVIRKRVENFMHIVDRALPCSSGESHGMFTFSKPMPHGERGNGLGTVMMTRIESEGEVFVHASDIQLLDPDPVERIIEWQPSVVIVSGPSLYRNLSDTQKNSAWKNAVELASHVDTCIIDHHLMRSNQGISWLRKLDSEVDARVICAADFMKQQRKLLEAGRSKLYEEIPVPRNWHRDYALGKQNTHQYQHFRYN